MAIRTKSFVFVAGSCKVTKPEVLVTAAGVVVLIDHSLTSQGHLLVFQCLTLNIQ